MVHSAYPLVAALFPVLALIAWWRLVRHKKPYYRYASCAPFSSQAARVSIYPERLLYALRLIALALLLIVLLRPRKPDVRSALPVHGIDIMLVLDVSGSMNCFDDMREQRTRIDSAKKEALEFIHKRPHDAIGLVLFGAEVLARCPLTLDKSLLNELIAQTHVGILQSNGTLFSRALLTAIQRLQSSGAQTKIIIALTDGEPSAGDQDPRDVVHLAKKVGIKIYTIGVGSVTGGFQQAGPYGIVQTGSVINTALLKFLAQETGGTYFHAQNAQDLKQIYTTIDKLEKTEHALQYGSYTEYFWYILIIACILLSIEIIASSWIWLSL